MGDISFRCHFIADIFLHRNDHASAEMSTMGMIFDSGILYPLSVCVAYLVKRWHQDEQCEKGKQVKAV